MKRLLALVLSLVLLSSLAGCAERTVVFDIKEASTVKIFSGSTGLSATVTDAESIEKISDNFNSLSFEKDKSSRNYDGFGYSLTWYDGDGEVVESVVVQGENRIDYNGYFYDETTDGEIDTQYLDMLLGVYEN